MQHQCALVASTSVLLPKMQSFNESGEKFGAPVKTLGWTRPNDPGQRRSGHFSLHCGSAELGQCQALLRGRRRAILFWRPIRDQR